jgi:hypothetical protein
MDSEREQAAELLERAADGFESGRYYWTRGQYSKVVFGTRAYCSLGALAHEQGQHPRLVDEHNPVMGRAIEALAKQIMPDRKWQGSWWDTAGSIVVGFNDLLPKGEASKRQVIDHMKHAAKDLRNE